jgi:hypothetical protein
MGKRKIVDQEEAWIPPQEEDSSSTASPEAAEKLKAPFLQLAQMRAQKDDLEREMTELNQLYADQEYTCLQALEKSGLKNIPIKGVGLFFGSVHVRPKTVDEPSLFEDLRSRDAGDLIKETVHHKSLGAFIKELKERGEWEANPLKGVEIFEQPFIGFRREGGARDGKHV